MKPLKSFEKIWILSLVTIVVITGLIFIGIKLFSTTTQTKIISRPGIYHFSSDICNIDFDINSTKFSLDKKCGTNGSKIRSWYMICSSPNIGNLGRAMELRFFFRQDTLSYFYAFDIMQKHMKNYTLTNFVRDLDENRFRECMFQYPMQISK